MVQVYNVDCVVVLNECIVCCSDIGWVVVVGGEGFVEFCVDIEGCVCFIEVE